MGACYCPTGGPHVWAECPHRQKYLAERAARREAMGPAKLCQIADWRRALRGFDATGRKFIAGLIRLATMLGDDRWPERMRLRSDCNTQEPVACSLRLWSAIFGRQSDKFAHDAVCAARRCALAIFGEVLATPVPPEAVFTDMRPGNYYVSAMLGEASRLVAGPYPLHADALAAVSGVRSRAVREYGTSAEWAAWGTARTEVSDERPTLYGQVEPDGRTQVQRTQARESLLAGDTDD